MRVQRLQMYGSQLLLHPFQGKRPAQRFIAMCLQMIMTMTTMTTTMTTRILKIGMRMDRGWFRRAKWMGTSTWGPQDTIFDSANPVHFGIPRAAKTAKTASFVTCANLVRRSVARRRRVPTSEPSPAGQTERQERQLLVLLLCWVGDSVLFFEKAPIDLRR